MTQAHWFTHLEHGGFPIEKAAIGACDLSVLHVGGDWQWLVQCEGRDFGEGAAPDLTEAKQDPETVALAVG
jgi:hypothetical protein